MIIDRDILKMPEKSNVVAISFSIILFFLLILLLIATYNSKCQVENAEKFGQTESVGTLDVKNRTFSLMEGSENTNVRASDPAGNEYFRQVEDNNTTDKIQQTQILANCPSKDKLSAADLLPLDANSKNAAYNPHCAGDLQDQNYLTAGYHIGINSVGNKRNANLQLRYEPPNPQTPVSPWLISTIEPQNQSHGLLDIGSAPIYTQ